MSGFSQKKDKHEDVFAAAKPQSLAPPQLAQELEHAPQLPKGPAMASAKLPPATTPHDHYVEHPPVVESNHGGEDGGTHDKPQPSVQQNSTIEIG